MPAMLSVERRGRASRGAPSSDGMTSKSWQTEPRLSDDQADANDTDVSTEDGVCDFDDEGSAPCSLRNAAKKEHSGSSDSLVQSLQSESDDDSVTSALHEFEAQLDRIGREGLVSTLGAIVENLVNVGEEKLVPPTSGFHAQAVPGINLKDYYNRLAQYYQCSDASLIIALILMERVAERPEIAIQKLTVHRLLCVSLVVAAKVHDDIFYTNKFYARVAGLKAMEMNRLEEVMLHITSWKMHVSNRLYCSYLDRVVLPRMRMVETAARK